MTSSILVCFILSLVSYGRSFTFLRSPTTGIQLRNNAARLNMMVNPFGPLLTKSSSTANDQSPTIAEKFIENWNANRITEAMELVDDEIEFEDTIFPGPLVGKNELERTLRLRADIPNRETIVIKDIANDESAKKVGLKFQTETPAGVSNKKGAASFVLNPESGLIKKVFWVKESSKSGEENLQTLRLATSAADIFKSKGKSEIKNELVSTTLSLEAPPNAIASFFSKKSSSSDSALTLPEQYFAAWNERDMVKACSVFSQFCEYDDTAFPQPFQGKEALERHLNICADCFPSTFAFCIDDQIIGKNGKFFVQWHVENNGEQLLFTRGCSFYSIENGKIAKGIDFVEPALFKTGSLSLITRSVVSKVSGEPIRWVPLVTWIAYMYVVFFSDWFYGLPATALEQRTWEEVRDLSLNFFLVSPIFHLPFAPVVHPMLEGVFNLLLSWAALFAGFLSDDRRQKPNVFPMLPTVAGMQFLTSAFLLPYLVTRSNEKDNALVYQEDLGQVARVTESRTLAPFLMIVGTGSILWGILARSDTFGGWNERVTSFLELLSIDRVGSSFLVDLAIFAVFQGWLVDDDVKRRGMDGNSPLVSAAKYFPFFGMAAYLTFRNALPSREMKS